MNESIRTRAMRRIVAVYYLKKVINMTTLKVGLLGLTALAFGSLVHVAAVFNNMPALTDVAALYNFGTVAFMAAGALVQATVVTAVLLGAWIARDFIKEITAPRLQFANLV